MLSLNAVSAILDMQRGTQVPTFVTHSGSRYSLVRGFVVGGLLSAPERYTSAKAEMVFDRRGTAFAVLAVYNEQKLVLRSSPVERVEISAPDGEEIDALLGHP
jgi:hypothetical protein